MNYGHKKGVAQGLAESYIIKYNIISHDPVQFIDYVFNDNILLHKFATKTATIPLNIIIRMNSINGISDFKCIAN